MPAERWRSSGRASPLGSARWAAAPGRSRPRLPVRRRDVVGRRPRARGRFRVLKPDLPGRGETAAPVRRRAIEDYADFLEAILAELPEPAGLAGFSMGGYVALALRPAPPAALGALALVDTRAQADDEAGRAKRDEAIATVRSSGARGDRGGDDAASCCLRLSIVQRATSSSASAASCCARSPRPSRRTSTAMRDRPDARPSLAGIAIPTLVVVGERRRLDAAGRLRGHGRGDSRGAARHDPRRRAPHADGTPGRRRRGARRLLRGRSRIPALRRGSRDRALEPTFSANRTEVGSVRAMACP